ncbi:MarR family transcriptional regulator [Photobacterium phosphoreum]
MSKTQLRVLKIIKRGEQITPKIIATRCNITSSYSSTLLKKLFEKNYLN